MWNRGLNFSAAKYKILGNNTFQPHVRSSNQISIPRIILERFSLMGNDVALVEIEDAAKRTVVKRIKKLSKSGKSKIISFKAEKSIANPIVRVLNILSEENALSRTSTEHDSIRHFTPKYTNKGEGGTPIYVFDSGESVIIGGYYKKDIEAKTKIAFNDADLSAIGLYMAEGGKTAASFTNSWPAAINPILHGLCGDTA